jgi:hypothetical protein
MKGIVLAEQGHIVNALAPVDITGGAQTDRVKMSNAGHLTAIVKIGVSAAAFTKILVNASEDAAGSNSEAIPFRMAKEETAGGDTLSGFEDVLAAGYSPSANDGIFYVIELDASELPDGKPWVDVQLTNGTNSVLADVTFILTGYRYQGSQNQTAIA